MKNNFKGKTVWITGASSGIGEALATEFALLGANIVISARRKEALDLLKSTLSGFNTAIFVLPLDLEKEGSFDDLTKIVLEQYGKIDLLINNAGISQRSLAIQTSIAVDERLMKVNYLGTVALTKAVLPYMVAQKGGKIVTITSAVGKFGSPWRSGYSASKHALHGFFDSLRAEVYDDNIKVLLVCPGFVHTQVSINALNENGESTQQMDTATQKGLSAEYTAQKIIEAIAKEKEEVVIGGLKERFGVWMKRHFPTVFSVMLRKMAVR
jgi:dehydrogenase/reductase SDR family protein 7B